MTVMQIKAVLDSLSSTLSKAGIADAELEVQFMLQHVLKCSRGQLFLKMANSLPESLFVQLQGLLARRMQREPLAYILGEWDFRGLTLAVGPDVLIPRPETEQLVDAVASLFANAKGRMNSQRALDVGCGSGAIAISLLKEGLVSQVVAMDISEHALMLCQANAKRNAVTDKMSLVAADLRQMPFIGQFDLVVGNLPYIDSNEIDTLMPEVSCFEPRLALDGGLHGTALFVELAAVLERILRPGGFLVLEIGADQENFIIELFQNRLYDSLAVLPDYAGLPRIFSARRHPAKTAPL